MTATPGTTPSAPTRSTAPTGGRASLAEIATLGAADPYDIHINWDRRTKVILDGQGNVQSVSGYPGAVNRGGAVYRVLLAGGLVIALTVVAGCSLFGNDHDSGDDRFVELDQPKDAPSDEFTASLVEDPDQNGVTTRVVVVTDADSQEVFRDDYAYSTRHGLAVTWLSSADQLWILSADVGTAHVDRRADGTWAKTAISPETANTVPDEIDRPR